jgi:hypothetical protein
MFYEVAWRIHAAAVVLLTDLVLRDNGQQERMPSQRSTRVIVDPADAGVGLEGLAHFPRY